MITEDEIFNILMRAGMSEADKADLYSEKISEEIETRICKNCIHHKSNGFCRRIEIGTLDGFGCTYWEST